MYMYMYMWWTRLGMHGPAVHAADLMWVQIILLFTN